MFLLLDKNIFEDELISLKEVLIKIAKLNIKGLFFYDLAVLNIVKENNLSIPLVWNQNFLVTNYHTCNYYHSMGVDGASISSVLTIEEIKEIVENSKLKSFVNIFGYQLMAASKRKLLSSYFKYSDLKEDKKEHIMIEKEISYPILEDKNGTIFLTKDVLDGILYLKKLNESNPDYLIFDEINIENETFLKVLEIYSEALRDLDNLEKYDKELECLISNRSCGFFDHKTIYKVKNYG